MPGHVVGNVGDQLQALGAGFLHQQVAGILHHQAQFEHLFLQVKPAGIRVTTLCPGSVDTEFFDRFRPSTERPQMLTAQDVTRELMSALTAPPNVLRGEIVIRPRVV